MVRKILIPEQRVPVAANRRSLTTVKRWPALQDVHLIEIPEMTL